MNHQVFVYVELDGTVHLAGTLWSRNRKGKESASFEYSSDWLARPNRFSLEPSLSLDAGSHHTGKALFGSIGDSAPDRWGRTLMRRAERQLARKESRAPRSLQEIDFLLMVSDESRLGALRFKDMADGPFLANTGIPVPPLVDLKQLLAASEIVEDDDDDDDDHDDQLALLLAPGSSLGGARPKASIRERDATLAIAKFPHKQDEWPVVRWEHVALRLAKLSGIDAAVSRIESVGDQAIIVLKRFDRDARSRIPFLSAMSMLGAEDGHPHSYIDIADAIRQHGARPAADLRELWRRMVFNILVSNTDDHLRNHGFLYQGNAGWILSPAYDLNPVPVDMRPRILTTLIDTDDGTASVELAFSVVEYFGLAKDDAREIAREVASEVSNWRDVAARQGLSQPEIKRMASAFEHDELKKTL